MRGSAPLRDLGAVGLAAALVWLLGARFDLLEQYLSLTAGHEAWQADELVFVLASLALGLLWYALRRWAEARGALRLHETAERRVGQLLSHNRELAQQLIAGQDRERRALARELHDELGQSCTAIRVEAALIERAAGEDPATARAAAQRIESLAGALGQVVRRMLQQLRPPELDELGLTAAIQALCDNWAARSGIDCAFHHAGLDDGQEIDDLVSVAVYRVAQEALANVMRHAAASQVRISLRRGAGRDARLLLEVADNGRGLGNTQQHDGLGLLGVRERAALLGGEVVIDGLSGRGLQLRMAIPLPAATAANGAAPAVRASAGAA